MGKKKFLMFIVGVMVSFLIATSPGIAQNEFEGVTLRFLGDAETAMMNFYRDVIKEFEKMTGARVLTDFGSWGTLMTKVITDVTSGAGRYDIFCSDIEFQYTLEPYLLPLDKYIEKYNYDMDGFFKPIYTSGVWSPKGVRYGLPFIAKVAPTFYRTDLLEECGLSEFPTTWEEFYKFMDASTKGDVYGISRAGVVHQLPRIFFTHYWSRGKPLLSPDWEPLINSEDGIWALEALKMESEKFQAPGWLGWGIPEASNVFLAGNAAICEMWPSCLLPQLTDPQQQLKIAGDWGIAPGWPEGGTPNFTQYNFLILRGTSHPEAAFKFIAYSTGPTNAKRMLLDYGLPSARGEFWLHPEVLAEHPYYANMAEANDRGIAMFPGMPQWLELFMALGEEISAYLSGETPTAKEALDTVAKKWEASIAANPLPFQYKE